MPRPIREIAEDIQRDWTKVNFAAAPYLNAMLNLNDLDDRYGGDTAGSIILYFLDNAASWRGPVAKAIKAELKTLMKPAKTNYKAPSWRDFLKESPAYKNKQAQTLRARVIRLAHAKPELRPHLLPLLKEGGE